VIQPRLFVCGGASSPSDTRRKEYVLTTQGPDANVNLRIDDVSGATLQNLPTRLTDFLEIAAYVYAADALTRRGDEWAADGTIEPWGRDLLFSIAVRDLAFWNDAQTKEWLTRGLRFLSDDKFEFTFQPQEAASSEQLYLSSGTGDPWCGEAPDRVVMFSGGLDSLAGAVECARQGQRIALVSHRSVAMLSKRQVELVQELRKLFPGAITQHVPVWVNKDKSFGREHTQRTRSFLFTALGCVVAASLGTTRISFFENGVVSINLPIADEVVRARASRTTHPQALQDLGALCAAVVEGEMVVENPFVFDTKRDVVARLAGDTAHLIARTCSCAHTGFFQSKTQWHCGACSQCIDRRTALIDAGLEGFDPETDYKTDVFAGPRKEGYERGIAINFVRHGLELEKMGEAEIAAKFSSELARAARPHPPVSGSVARFVAMHRRHGEAVGRVLKRMLGHYGADLLEGRLESTSLLALAVGQQHLKTSWERYAGRIADALAEGIPVACQTHKPIDEPHLQEISDGILRGQELKLQREFPFMAWGSSRTKPDWSDEAFALWVELKYVRQRREVRVAGAGIAEDITKYGDNGRKVLFVVYDPDHHITDEDEFGKPLEKRNDMFLRVMR
jgi:7-cyano-7-deazaguanine synthase in queuosine biosynthesis